MGYYILKEMNFSIAWEPTHPKYSIFTTRLHGAGRWAGRVMCAMSDNQHIVLDLTGPPGYVTGIYYGFTFTITKDEWFVEKVDEWIEANPAHGAYYTIAQAQKTELENKLKAGLASIQGAVSDYELIMHDIRKYQEFMGYIEDTESGDPKRIEEGELALRTIFVDQVDFFSGGGTTGQPGRLSMAFMRNQNIMPTLVDDFMRLKGDADFEKGGQFERGKLPDVERRMLQAKWKAYKSWKAEFRGTIRFRLNNLRPLADSRKRSIKEYREWLKPVIARHKLMEEGFTQPHLRKRMRTWFVRYGGTIVSFNGLQFWVWKRYPVFEMFPTPGELIAKEVEKIESDENWYPVDKWTRQVLLFGNDWGLINEYPWITEEWVKDKIAVIKHKKWWLKEFYYYTFTIIDLEKTNIKYPAGTEDEDGIFELHNWMLSQNVLCVKLLELLAKQEEFEFYINDLLGMPNEIKGRPVIFYRKRKGKWQIVPEHLERVRKFTFLSEGKVGPDNWPTKTEFASLKELQKTWPKSRFRPVKYREESRLKGALQDFARTLGFEFMIMRYPGPYERGFYERVSKYFMKPNGVRYGMIRDMFLEYSKFGKPAT